MPSKLTLRLATTTLVGILFASTIFSLTPIRYAEASDLMLQSGKYSFNIVSPSYLFDGQPQGSVFVTYNFLPSGQIHYTDSYGGNFTIKSITFNGKKIIPSGIYANSSLTELRFNKTGGETQGSILFIKRMSNGYVSPDLKVRIAGTSQVGGVLSLNFANPNYQLEKVESKSSRYVRVMFGSLGFDWGDSLGLNPYYDVAGKSLNYNVGTSFDIDPTTVGTSTTGTPIANYAAATAANGIHAVIYDNGTRIVIATSATSAGTSWNAPIDISTSTSMARSIFIDSSNNIYYSRGSGGGGQNFFRYGTIDTDGIITWTVAEQTITLFYADGIYSTITASSPTNIWITSGTSNAGNWYALEVRNYNGVTGTSKLNVTGLATNVPLGITYTGSTTSKAVVVYGSPHDDSVQSVALSYTTNSGTGWTAVTAPANSYGIRRSMASISGDVLYWAGRISSGVAAFTYTIGDAAVGNEQTISGFPSAPQGVGISASSTLTIISALDTSAVYSSATADSGVTWGAVVTRVTGETSIANVPVASHSIISSSYVSVWSAGSASPYNVRFHLQTITAPSNGAVSIAMDDTNNIYAQKQDYTLTVTITDVDGYADVATIDISFQQGVTVRETFRYTESTNAFSVTTSNNQYELGTGSAATRSGTTIDISLKFRLRWGGTEESAVDIKVTSTDDEAMSDTDTTSDYFDAVKTLTVSSFASDPVTYVNPSASLTMSGTVYYVNNPASSTASTSYPPDAEFTSVIIHDSAHATMATDSVIVNGAFSVAITAEATAGARTVHPYINMADADYTDADATGITDSYTVYATLTISAVYQFDQSTSLTAGLYLSYQDTTNGTGPTKYAYTASKTFYSIVPNDVIRLKVQWTNTTSTNGGVQVNGSAYVDITMDAVYTKTLYLSVFKSTVLAFQYSDASTSFPTAKVTSVVVTNTGNTTTLTLTTFSNIGLVRNGTYTISSTNIFGGDIKSTTSFTVTADSSTKTLVAKVHKPTLNFRRNDGTALTPTSFTVTAPGNGTSLVLTSFSTLVMVEGAYTPTALTYWSVDVKKNGTTFTPTSMSGQFTFNALIYSGTQLAFQYSDASTSFPAASVTSVVYTNPNGTQKTVTAFTDIGLVTTGTVTVDQVNIFGGDIKSTTSFSVTADSSTKTLVAKVHKPTLNFRRADKSTAFTPTSFQVTAPGNGTVLTISSSFSTLVMVEGAYTPSSLNMYGVDVKENATTFTPSSMSQQFTFNGKLYAVTLNFRDGDSSSVTPTSIVFTAPNSSSVSLSSGSITVTTVGSHSLSSINKHGVNVRLNTSDSFSPTSDGQGFTYNLRIYSRTPTFKTSGGSALNTAITSYTLTSPNTTATSGLTSGSSVKVTNGTSTLSAVLWRGITVTPTSNTFNAASGSPSINTNVYADSSGISQFGVDGGTISSIGFSSNQLSGTSTATGTKNMIWEVLSTPYRIDPASLTLNGTKYTAGASGWTWSNPVFTFSASFSILNWILAWDLGSGGQPPQTTTTTTPVVPSGGGSGGGVILTTTTTATMTQTTATIPFEATRAREVAAAAEVAQGNAIPLLVVIAGLAGVGLVIRGWRSKGAGKRRRKTTLKQFEASLGVGKNPLGRWTQSLRDDIRDLKKKAVKSLEGW